MCIQYCFPMHHNKLGIICMLCFCCVLCNCIIPDLDIHIYVCVCVYKYIYIYIHTVHTYIHWESTMPCLSSWSLDILLIIQDSCTCDVPGCRYSYSVICMCLCNGTGRPAGPLWLTHGGRGKVEAISQTPFSSAFSWMKSYEFWLKFQWDLFLSVHLSIFQHWFR